jgi:hypothetical protein
VVACFILLYFISLKNLRRWLEEKLREEVTRQLEIKLGSIFLSSPGRVLKLRLTICQYVYGYDHDFVVILIAEAISC